MVIRKMQGGKQLQLNIPHDMAELLNIKKGDRMIIDADIKEETITIRKMR